MEPQTTLNEPIIEFDAKPKEILDLKIYIDFQKCTGCGYCEEICPFGLLKRDFTGKYRIINAEACTECSACKRNCPEQAIFMQEQKGCGCLWDTINRKKNKGVSPLDSNDCCCG